MDPHLATATSFVVRVLSRTPISLYDWTLAFVYTNNAETPDHWWIPVMMVEHPFFFSFADPLFPSFVLVSPPSSLSLFFSLPPYSWDELLRARCLDRCGLVGRMVRWLVERPSPDPPAASIPIASFCLLPRLSDWADAHKYALRICCCLFSIHFNARSCNASPSFTFANVSR